MVDVFLFFSSYKLFSLPQTNRSRFHFLFLSLGHNKVWPGLPDATQCLSGCADFLEERKQKTYWNYTHTHGKGKEEPKKEKEKEKSRGFGGLMAECHEDLDVDRRTAK